MPADTKACLLPFLDLSGIINHRHTVTGHIFCFEDRTTSPSSSLSTLVPLVFSLSKESSIAFLEVLSSFPDAVFHINTPLAPDEFESRRLWEAPLLLNILKSHEPENTNVPHGEKWPCILVPGVICLQENVFSTVSVARSNKRIRLSLDMRI
jgi:hypothetical protein